MPPADSAWVGPAISSTCKSAVSRVTVSARGALVLLTSLVAAAWRLSYERITDWLTRYEALAETLGYEQLDPLGRRRPTGRAGLRRALDGARGVR